MSRCLIKSAKESSYGPLSRAGIEYNTYLASTLQTSDTHKNTKEDKWKKPRPKSCVANTNSKGIKRHVSFAGEPRPTRSVYSGLSYVPFNYCDDLLIDHIYDFLKKGRQRRSRYGVDDDEKTNDGDDSNPILRNSSYSTSQLRKDSYNQPIFHNDFKNKGSLTHYASNEGLLKSPNKKPMKKVVVRIDTNKKSTGDDVARNDDNKLQLRGDPTGKEKLKYTDKVEQPQTPQKVKCKSAVNVVLRFDGKKLVVERKNKSKNDTTSNKGDAKRGNKSSESESVDGGVYTGPTGKHKSTTPSTQNIRRKKDTKNKYKADDNESEECFEREHDLQNACSGRSKQDQFKLCRRSLQENEMYLADEKLQEWLTADGPYSDEHMKQISNRDSCIGHDDDDDEAHICAKYNIKRRSSTPQICKHSTSKINNDDDAINNNKTVTAERIEKTSVDKHGKEIGTRYPQYHFRIKPLSTDKYSKFIPKVKNDPNVLKRGANNNILNIDYRTNEYYNNSYYPEIYKNSAKISFGQVMGTLEDMNPIDKNKIHPYATLPRKRQTNRDDKRERINRCVSLGGQPCPTHVRPSNDTKPTAKVYELVNDGWVNDKRGGDQPTKRYLNLDTEINDMIQTNSAAVISFGKMKLIF